MLGAGERRLTGVPMSEKAMNGETMHLDKHIGKIVQAALYGREGPRPNINLRNLPVLRLLVHLGTTLVVTGCPVRSLSFSC
jgi:hypothetical protein